MAGTFTVKLFALQGTQKISVGNDQRRFFIKIFHIYNPLKEVPNARRTKPANNRKKLFGVIKSMDVKWPMIPAMPRIRPIIHTNFVGADAFMADALMFFVLVIKDKCILF